MGDKVEVGRRHERMSSSVKYIAEGIKGLGAPKSL